MASEGRRATDLQPDFLRFRVAVLRLRVAALTFSDPAWIRALKLNRLHVSNVTVGHGRFIASRTARIRAR